MIWHFNLEGDFELQHRGYRTPALLDRQLAPHREAAARALMVPGDSRLGDSGSGLGRAWCWTTQALRAFAHAGVEPEAHPDVEIVRRVNHRHFAHTLGGGLPEQRWITKDAALPPPYILKRPLAFSGRGQLRVTGPLPIKDRAWIDASLEKDGLILEPLVQPLVEYSLHGMLAANGALRVGNLCEQLTTSRGVFLQMKKSDAKEPLLVRRLERVAEALFSAGYFGPFGIDAYRYAGGLCELGEINARYTMGFSVGFSVGFAVGFST